MINPTRKAASTLILLASACSSLCKEVTARVLITKSSAPQICKENLSLAANNQNGLLNQQTYLTFLDIHTDGMIRARNFNDLDLSLVHIYWEVMCSLNSEECTVADSIKVEEIMAPLDDDGFTLCDRLCHRVNDFLFGIILTYSPTYHSSSSPSVKPSLMYSTEPSPSPSIKVVSALPTSIAISDNHTSRPSLAPSVKQSSIPNIGTSVQPTSREPGSKPVSTFNRRPSYAPSINDATLFPSLYSNTVASQSPSLNRSEVPTVFPSKSLAEPSTKLPSHAPFRQPTRRPSLLSKPPAIEQLPESSATLTFSLQITKRHENAEMKIEKALENCIESAMACLGEPDLDCLDKWWFEVDTMSFSKLSSTKILLTAIQTEHS